MVYYPWYYNLILRTFCFAGTAQLMVLDPSFGLFTPDTSIVYNFEPLWHADWAGSAHGSLPPVLAAWAAHDNLWDYADGNVAELARRGLIAK